MNEEIHSARDVAKVHAAAGPPLPRRTVRWAWWRRRATLVRALTRPHTTAATDIAARLDALPLVGVVTSHGNMRAEIHDACGPAWTRAIVHAGFGGGTVPEYLKSALAVGRQRAVCCWCAPYACGWRAGAQCQCRR